jgi:hypothetical protein
MDIKMIKFIIRYKFIEKLYLCIIAKSSLSLLIHTLARSTANPMTESKKSTLPAHVSLSFWGMAVRGVLDLICPSSDIDVRATLSPLWHSITSPLSVGKDKID